MCAPSAFTAPETSPFATLFAAATASPALATAFLAESIAICDDAPMAPRSDFLEPSFDSSTPAATSFSLAPMSPLALSTLS